MRAGSLCTGIGGLDLAVEGHFGASMVWCAEYEVAPSSVIERHWPGVPNLRDLTAIDWRDVEPVDVLTAGYPCQPFSHAGKRKGTNDERHLWPYIAEAVRVLRPRFVVLENVAGHLSLGFGDVLRDLAEAGFDAEWCVLRASDVGACHQRARLFVVARDADCHVEDPGGRHAPREDAEPGRGGRDGDARRAIATDAGGERHGGGQDPRAVGRVDSGDAGAARQRQWPWEVASDRSATTVADADVRRREQRDEGFGGVSVANSLRQEDAPDADELGCHRLTAGVGDGRHAPERGQAVHLADDGAAPRAIAWGQYAPAIRRHERALGRPAPAPTDDAGRLSPTFVEWMQMYPEGWVDGLTRTQALKALGNAVVPMQAMAALAELAPISEERAA